MFVLSGGSVLEFDDNPLSLAESTFAYQPPRRLGQDVPRQ